MSETATYKQTTFAEAQRDIQQFEQQPVVETPPLVEAPPVTVNESGVIEAPHSQAAPEVAIPEPVVEENVSAFDLGEPTPVATPTETVTPPPAFNLDEELKKIDKKELLKKLGVNDFTIEMDEYLAKGGKADDYISKRGIDWSKVSDEDLIKQDLKNIYPDATQQQIERLYNKKYTQQEIDTEEDREDGVLLMRADARKIRDQKLQEQNSFKIPEAIIPPVKYEEAYLQWKQQQESQPALMKQLNDFYQNHEATKSINESKRVAINLGEGVPQFNFSINNPDAITRMYTDGGETWQKVTSTPTGEPDVQKQQLIGLFTYNPQKFMQDIFNYGRQLGKRDIVGEGQNAQKPTNKAPIVELNQTSYGVGKFGDKGRN
jgi:hypothetical protein